NPQILNVYPDYRIQTPAKITGSLAYVFGTQGLISFDYSRKDYSTTKFKPQNDYFGLNTDISNSLTVSNTYRVGGEYKIQQVRSEEHTSELQSRGKLVCRLLI